MDLAEGDLKLTEDLFSQSATNKVHDLNSISFGENRFGPFITPDYSVVKLNRNSRRRQRELADEIIQRCLIPYLARFTINLNKQCFLDRPQVQLALAGRMIRRNSALRPSSFT